MSSNGALKKGPDGVKEHAPLSMIFLEGRPFRMRYALGDQTIAGYIVGEYTGLEPLEEYGKQCGCTTIEYERNGQWTPLGS